MRPWEPSPTRIRLILNEIDDLNGKIAVLLKSGDTAFVDSSDLRTLITHLLWLVEDLTSLRTKNSEIVVSPVLLNADVMRQTNEVAQETARVAAQRRDYKLGDIALEVLSKATL